MKVKLTNVAAQRLLTALRNIDNNENVKLAGLTRLDIARNINRMFPLVTSFERVASARRRELMPGEENHAANNIIVDDLEKMSYQEVEFKLIAIDKDLLRLDDNSRITGETIASLAPIIKGFDSLKDDDDEPNVESS